MKRGLELTPHGSLVRRGLPANLFLNGEEMRAQLILRDEATRLAIDRAQRPLRQGLVLRNGQELNPTLDLPPDRRVASPCPGNFEPEGSKRAQDLPARQRPKTG